ncbi:MULTISPECIES: ABC transporter permease [Streptomyces]|uniref:ABC transporter permease n=1 Tax=Streptomyces TaxID=1883 RepID=UPI0004BD30EA|nr:MULTISPECIES: ABC transporter permease [unclassified Streptomyces]KPC73677.1 transporter [Streptomyces sp. NRRL F-6602]
MAAGRVRKVLGRAVWGVRAYGFIAAMWIRSSWAYRASFWMMLAANFATTALDFVAIMLMFSQVDALGGFSLPEVAFLYGTACVAFGLADLILGTAERVGRRVRDGTMDVLLTRPVPVLSQVAADRFALRRLGRILQGTLVLGWALTRLELDWTAGRVALLVSMLLCGGVIFGCLFVVGGAFQFWAQDAAEVQNAFTYGGTTVLQYPPTVFGKELVRGVTFVVPLAFVNWLPALRLLGRDDPLGLPGWADLAAPAVALVCCLVAGLVWRAGLRAYRSTGN